MSYLCTRCGRGARLLTLARADMPGAMDRAKVNYVFLVFESAPHECQHLVGVYPSRRDADAVASRLSALADSTNGSCWYRYTVIQAEIGRTQSLLDGEIARGLHKIAGDK